MVPPRRRPGGAGGDPARPRGRAPALPPRAGPAAAGPRPRARGRLPVGRDRPRLLPDLPAVPAHRRDRPLLRRARCGRLRALPRREPRAVAHGHRAVARGLRPPPRRGGARDRTVARRRRAHRPPLPARLSRDVAARGAARPAGRGAEGARAGGALARQGHGYAGRLRAGRKSARPGASLPRRGPPRVARRRRGPSAVVHRGISRRDARHPRGAGTRRRGLLPRAVAGDLVLHPERGHRRGPPHPRHRPGRLSRTAGGRGQRAHRRPRRARGAVQRPAPRPGGRHPDGERARRTGRRSRPTATASSRA